MKKGFYLKFLESQNNSNKDFVLVNTDNSKFVVVLNYIENLITSILKTLMYVSIFVFVSVGITAIINPSIRGIFLNLF